MTQDENRTQATDSGLSQSKAFPPLSLDHSDVARERDIMLIVHVLGGTSFQPLALGTWSLLWRPVLCS